jgi:hypothetical protein
MPSSPPPSLFFAAAAVAPAAVAFVAVVIRGRAALGLATVAAVAPAAVVVALVAALVGIDGGADLAAVGLAAFPAAVVVAFVAAVGLAAVAPAVAVAFVAGVAAVGLGLAAVLFAAFFTGVGAAVAAVLAALVAAALAGGEQLVAERGGVVLGETDLELGLAVGGTLVAAFFAGLAFAAVADAVAAAVAVALAVAAAVAVALAVAAVVVATVVVIAVVAALFGAFVVFEAGGLHVTAERCEDRDGEAEGEEAERVAMHGGDPRSGGAREKGQGKLRRATRSTLPGEAEVSNRYLTGGPGEVRIWNAVTRGSLEGAGGVRGRVVWCRPGWPC